MFKVGTGVGGEALTLMVLESLLAKPPWKQSQNCYSSRENELNSAQREGRGEGRGEALEMCKRGKGGEGEGEGEQK